LYIGSMTKEMVKANKYYKMEKFLKEFGKMIVQTDKEFLHIYVVWPQVEFGFKEKEMDNLCSKRKIIVMCIRK